ncbi:MAG: dethiobiotin synthase [Candidatus Nanopelagicales bacterium]|nr:ATP-dependent dethiobiotin synthetase BioD [Candidatus Nanopelagicales bacterium]
MSGTILTITGTGTSVGKTVVTAALAALAVDAGQRVAVVKPGQTGVRGDDLGDVDDVRRLAGVADTYELARFSDPLAPAAAARIAHVPPIDVAEVARQIREIAEDHDLVLVEGSGGLLVEFDDQHHSIADIAQDLGSDSVVVIAPNLGTLNHTALTLEVMRHRGLALAGVIIGSWPKNPDLSCCTNLDDIESIAGEPLSGAIRENRAKLGKSEFLEAARKGLAPKFGGEFDAADFRQRFDYRRIE